VEGAERVEAIVKDLRMFSRADDQTVKAIDPQVVLDSALRMVSTDIRHRARLIRDYQSTPKVLANQARLSQVFLNLLVNAVQSLDHGDAKHDEIGVHTSTDEAGNAVIKVTDTGIGIKPEHIDRIFDPFFSTKPIGIGTGLGLSMCHNIVKSMKGEIRVASTPGQGASFRIVLPAAPEAADAMPDSETHPTTVHRAPCSRVLIIDDDHAVAQALRQTLEHHITTVANCGEAALWELQQSEFDVILCDIMMPGMTGLELFERLATVRREYQRRLVFITGGALTEAARAFLEGTCAPWLEKPISADQLEAAISQVLAAQGCSGKAPAVQA